MNDRINDLAVCKAGAILMDLVMPDTENPYRINWNINCTKEHLINFADIIINETIKVSLKNSHRDDDMGSIIAKDIKKHFYENIHPGT